MQGEIINFDTEQQLGMILGEDKKHYQFDLTGWRGRGLPDQGIMVSFDADGEQARQVFNLPAGQMNAQALKEAGTDEIRPVQTSFWSVMAIGAAAMSIPLGYFVALFALLFAVMGFREARLQPERYKGKGMALAAGSVASVVLILTVVLKLSGG